MTVFAMTLVVAGHCDITDDYKTLWIYKWVYSFHMPLFFFISGFLFCLTNPLKRIESQHYLSFIKKKFKRLMVPYIVFSSIIYVIKSLCIVDKTLMQHPLQFSLIDYIYTILFNPIGYMWFLPTLFMVFMFIYPFWSVIIKTSYRIVYLLICLVGLIFISDIINRYSTYFEFMQMSKAVHFTFYFILGISYCITKKRIDEFIYHCWFIVPVLVISSVCIIFSGIIGAVIGIMMTVSISLLIPNKYLDKVSKYSEMCYTVFLLSYFPQMFIRGPIAHSYMFVNQYFFSIISFIAGIAFPIIIGINVLQLKKKGIKLIKDTSYLIGL